MVDSLKIRTICTDYRNFIAEFFLNSLEETTLDLRSRLSIYLKYDLFKASKYWQAAIFHQIWHCSLETSEAMNYIGLMPV